MEIPADALPALLLAGSRFAGMGTNSLGDGVVGEQGLNDVRLSREFVAIEAYARVKQGASSGTLREPTREARGEPLGGRP